MREEVRRKIAQSMSLEGLRNTVEKTLEMLSENYKKGLITVEEAYDVYSNTIRDELSKLRLDNEDVYKENVREIYKEAHICSDTFFPDDVERVYEHISVMESASNKEEYVIGRFEVIDLGNLCIKSVELNKKYNLLLREYESRNPLQKHHCSFWIYDYKNMDLNHKIDGESYFKKLSKQIPFDEVVKAKNEHELTVDDYFEFKLDSKGQYYHGVGKIEGYLPFECVLMKEAMAGYPMIFWAVLKEEKGHKRWDKYYEQVEKNKAQVELDKQWFLELLRYQ